MFRIIRRVLIAERNLLTLTLFLRLLQKFDSSQVGFTTVSLEPMDGFRLC